MIRVRRLKKKQKEPLQTQCFAYAVMALCGFVIFVTAKARREGLDLTVVMHRVLTKRPSLNSYTLVGSETKLRYEDAQTTTVLLPIINDRDTINLLSTRQHTSKCEHGQFYMSGMEKCRPWLACGEIHAEVSMGNYFESDPTKKLQRGTWKGYQVAIQHPITEKGKNSLEDFNENLRNHVNLQSQYITQLIGFCNVSKSASKFGRSYIVTEYHARRSISDYLKTSDYRSNNATTRMKLAISYLEVLLYLHTLPQGPRIVCDTNTLEDTLRQFLVTKDNAIILSDLNDLPLVDKKTGKLAQCKHQDFLSERADVTNGYFLAPEQIKAILTHFPKSVVAKKFESGNETEIETKATDKEGRLPPSLDEKVDVYKIPDMTEAFLLLNKKELKNDEHNQKCIELWNALHSINSQCKEHSPELRPSVEEVLKVYKDVIKGK